MAAVMRKPPPMDPDEGIIQLPGDDSRWIWAFTCPALACSCRDAIVLSAPGDRVALRKLGAPVREAWLRREAYVLAAAKLAHVTVFDLGIDGANVSAVGDSDAYGQHDIPPTPRVREVVDRIDGDILEAIGRLWYRSKGWPDPEKTRRQAEELPIKGWQSGARVSWKDLLGGVRWDLYECDDRLFEAVECYCVAKACGCGEVVVRFEPNTPRGIPPPGAVRVTPSGESALEPTHEKHRERLEQLWAAFQKRHPHYRERFSRRCEVMHGLGEKVVTATSDKPALPPVRTGRRNDLCPCGSGEKYRVCCGMR